MAQSVKHSTLDFDSGHDLMFLKTELHIELCTDSKEPAWNSLSTPPQLVCTRVRALSLKNKLKKKKKKKTNLVTF